MTAKTRMMTSRHDDGYAGAFFPKHELVLLPELDAKATDRGVASKAAIDATIEKVRGCR